MITRNTFLSVSYLAIVSLLYLAAPVLATPSGALPSIFSILSEENIEEITIATNLAQLIENRRSDAYVDATLSYEKGKKQVISYPIQLQVRGKFRRRICDFPPVKIKFAKKDLEAAGIHKAYNSMKLVTHCMDDKEMGNENVLKEYLTYKLYNELSPRSFRVHLVKVNYIDTEGKTGKTKRYGILIEDTDEMAARLGGKEYEVMNVNRDSVSPKDEVMVGLFQYMIANADWNLPMLRNVKLVLPEGSAKTIPVPYDFDFSGLVNASYALPQTDRGLTSMRDRLYLGNPFDKAVMRSVMQHFISHKQALLDIVKQFKPLNMEARADMEAYLSTFFDVIEPVYADDTADLNLFFYKKNATPADAKQNLQQGQDNGATSSLNK